MNPALQAASVPDGTTTPATLQEWLAFLVNYLRVTGFDDLEGVIVSATEPGVDDQDKLWVRLAVTGNALGFYVYNGSWTAVPVIFPSHTTAARPDNPNEGQVGLNTSVSGLELYVDGAWTSLLLPHGTTDERPTGQANNYHYFDTSIGKWIRYVSASSAWTTVDGGEGELRMFYNVAIATLLTQFPGWVEATEMAGLLPVGQGGDYALNETGGRDSFEVKIKRQQINAASQANVVGTLNIDGVDQTSPDTEQTAYGNAQEVSVLNPYRAVAIIRKSIH